MPSKEASRRNQKLATKARSEKRLAYNVEGQYHDVMKHCLEIGMLPRVNKDNPEEVYERGLMYFQACEDNDQKPLVEGLATAFGINRKTLLDWHTGEIRLPKESWEWVDRFYSIINMSLAQHMVNGHINPVDAIFLMKNNLGYRDEQQLVVGSPNQFGDLQDNKDLEQKYSEVVAIDVDCEDVE